MIGFDVKKTLHSLKHICHMSKNVLQILICLVGYICKKAKSSYIGKCLLIKSADITVIELLLHDHLCGFDHVFRHKQTVRKIIRTAGRNIPDRYLTSRLHDSGNHFIQSTVSSAAYDQIDRVCILLCFLVGILRRLGSPDNDLIIMSAENINDIKQICLDLALSCFGIKNKEHFLSHGLVSPFFLNSYAFNIIQQNF